MYWPSIVHCCCAMTGPSLVTRLVAVFFEDALVQVADDHTGQPLVVDEEALADRVGVLLGDLERLFQDLVGSETAIDETLDIADPILDDLRLLLEIRLGARVAVPGDDGLDIERL